MTLLRVDASIRSDGSHSRALADTVQAAWMTTTTSGAEVIRRDIGATPIPATFFGPAVEGAHQPSSEWTEPQRIALSLAAQLVDELDTADAIVFAVPLYNFGVSQHFKAYVDLAITDHRMGPRPTLLRGKPAELVVARGGHYAAGTARDGWDHALPWMQRILAEVWGLDLSITEIDLTMAAVDPSMESLIEQAQAMQANAEHTAYEHGIALAHRSRTFRAA